MGTSGSQPKLAVIVANDITGDSRVQKIAVSAARAGWDVTLVGRARGDRVERSSMGLVNIVRVPVGNTMRRVEKQRRRRTLRSRVTQFALPTRNLFENHRARFDSGQLRRQMRISELSRRRAPLTTAAALALKVVNRLRAEAHRVRVRAYEWEDAHAPDYDAALGSWRRDAPQLLDLELAFVGVLERLRPDVIHANDITMLNTAAAAAARLRNAGHAVSWLYDAHEYVAGVDWPTPRLMSAYPQVERELIHAADAVVTVSPEIADIIAEEHGLKSAPLVVRNTPIREAIDHRSAPSVRATAGVDEGTPLLVYSGYIHSQRGLDRAIEALPHLPEFHLAIVAGRATPELKNLQQLARRLGVQPRVHVVPYVDAKDVPAYLSSADIGIICSHRTINYELSLPTKLAEYLHAGLPVIASDLQTLSAFVREHDLGLVFDPDEPLSFERAVEELFPRRAEVASHITEDLVTELSWEYQTDGLLELYAAMSGRRPERPRGEVGWDLSEGPARASRQQTEGDQPGHGGWRELTMSTPVRLGFGPANFAGQLAAFAQAVTHARGDVSAEVIMHVSQDSFGYPADVYVKHNALKRLDVQIEQLQRILPRYTHLVADAFRPVFGGLNGSSIASDLPTLTRAGIKVALLSHGTDTRHPMRHRERNPYSLYFDAPEGFAESRVAVVERNHRIVENSGLPTFVTTPDLLDDLPTATWVPLVVDIAAWACDRPVMERARPVVLHAPSKRWTKGTDRFAGALEELARRGLIEFELVEGLPWAAMRERVQNADIVVDQFAIGSYGTFACEAMAAGKPVIAYLDESVSRVVGEEPPIVNTTPDKIVDAISALLDDRDESVLLGSRSADYVRRVHDGRRSAAALTGFIDGR